MRLAEVRKFSDNPIGNMRNFLETHGYQTDGDTALSAIFFDKDETRFEAESNLIQVDWSPDDQEFEFQHYQGFFPTGELFKLASKTGRLTPEQQTQLLERLPKMFRHGKLALLTK